LGSSGVGKTTLLNNLIGDAIFTTKTIRKKDGKGRHATTYRQLIKLECEAMIIDTPGMRELGNFSV
jgi:ribosome biogenesis GTPase